MRKIAIIGKCSNTRLDSLGVLQNSDWEVWTLAWDLVPITHRMFEVHEFWRNYRDNPEDAAAHLETLKTASVPVYMNKVEPDVPMSVEYPFEEVATLIGRGSNGHAYLESSIGVMMGLAILECSAGDRIGIWGVDMGTKGEYSYQRPNMEYLIGFARGRGIKVFIPPQSELLSSAHKERYGVWQAA